jgi:two-component system, LytTR family, sensor kinase
MSVAKAKQLLRERYIYFHVLYWIFNVLYFTTQRFAFYGNEYFLPSLKLILAYLPVILIFTYFVTEIVIPRYFQTRKLLNFLASLLGILIIYPAIAYLERIYIIEPYVFNDHIQYSLYNSFMAVMIFGFGAVPVAGFKIALLIKKEAKHHEAVEKEKIEAELKLREAELKLLKGQIHPHFLFNTLNNAYFLAIEKSEKTADVIIKLADMFSFLTYDCNSDKVELSKDIDFVNNYLDLQSLRYDSCSISMKVTGNMDNLQIAPMILHTFIENSFKHGAENVSGNSWIRIYITINERTLNFSVSNSKCYLHNGEGNGIGLANAARRLELLYPGCHDLIIKDIKDEYSVFLRLEL